VIWNLCINRPVLTMVVFMITAIFGIFGYVQMPIRENPQVEFPVISVSVVLPGAEPEVVETEIIEHLEEAINTVEGLRRLTSTAGEQSGTVTAEFELWRDIDIAAQDVRDVVNRAQRDLPEGIEAPVVRKLDPDARPIMWIALTGDERWDAVRLTTYADEVIRPQLESIRGAGRVQIGGERRYAVRLVLDADRMAAHGLTVQDVVQTVRLNNVDIPSGRVESLRREFLVKTQGQFSDAEPMNELIVTSREGIPVRIRDVGLARDGVENERQIARFNGQVAVGIGVVKLAEANTVEVADAVRARMATLATAFPSGLTYTIASDDSVFVRDSINDLLITIVLAGILVVLVIMLFLRSLWGTLIAALAIPSSLLGGMAIMALLGFSVNTLTMLGLILAIGIVIDDSIVVMESSYRHLEHGTDPVPAARIGTTEVAFAAIANTLSLAAVFIPVAFTAGMIGRFFMEFGLTVAATVFFSTFTALTLTPMLCSRLLRRTERPGPAFRLFEQGFERVERVYARVLATAFAHKGLTILIGAGALLVGLFLFTRLPTEFAPAVDRAQLFITFRTPEGATMEETDSYAARVEGMLSETEEISHFFMVIGFGFGGGPGSVNQGVMFVSLVPRGDRDLHQSEVVHALRARLGRIPGGQAFVFEGGMAIGTGFGQPIELVLQSPDLNELAAVQDRTMEWMRDRTEFIGVNTNFRVEQPQVEVRIHRDRAALMGISVTEIGDTMRFLLGEPTISRIERESRLYDVITEISGKGQMVPEDLSSLFLRTAAGSLVPMGVAVELRESIGPSQIHHHNRNRSATVSASTPPGVALGDALDVLENHLVETLPPGIMYEFTGQAQEFREAFRNLTLTILLSVLFIYLVLSAQFESFLLPLVMLMALPLALVGAFGALWALNMQFGIVAFIGLIMLMGMATKNAILMIDYTNVLAARGSPPEEAAGQAARIRFRPVIMTTVSTVIGIMPIALGFGVGGEARAPMGVAVAAGLTATTGLTLVVIPVLYTLTQGLRSRIKGTSGGRQ
jgi:multidrug efflux pump